MTFMYRLQLDCAHFILHGPEKDVAYFHVGEDAVCQICPPIPGSGWGKVYPSRRIVNVQEIPQELQFRG